MLFNSFDISDWPRKKAYEFYKGFDDPFFNVTAQVDVTDLLDYCRKENLSFFMACMHVCIRAANNIVNFRLRFDGEGLREYHLIHGGSTVLYDDESFGFAYYDYVEELEKFCENSEKIINDLKKTKSFDPSGNKEDLIYFSSLPWIEFTSIKHAYDSHINPGIPRISFGKYSTSEGVVKMPINVEINHALADGLHVGRFFKFIQSYIHESKNLLY